MRRRALLAAALAPATARAETGWRPTRPLRLIVPFAPGGALDITARLLGWEMEALVGVPIQVENRSGAGGNIGAETAARAAPDGHTLLVGSPGPLVVNPLLFPAMPFEPEVDFVPVALATRNPVVLLAGPRRPERRVAHLVQAAQAGEFLTYSSAGPGSGGHVAMEVLKARLGLPGLPHIPFRGAGPSLEALAAGQVTYAAEAITSAAGFIEGRLAHPLAVTTAERWPGLPGVPTVAEEGLPGFDYASWTCLVYPAGVAEEPVLLLNWAVNVALARPALRARLLELGAEPAGGSATQLARHLRDERGKWQEAVRISGARVF
ncbi:Bug family tripartite tricarboxylate transporter substrate binding protein [Falsiroseomonas selenitidurans]|uniref:Tripartite tricarboxylate transporter substrate binding protein n=1 Tax=Falsiroseomonas selenitidurans TaxID=2716335 RepID=A0ABX1E4T1_9PROT|nr:tripartite tricarboxylate transporter substrate binding protein [Falsiroseomonas selenitidurans]NKC30818.1 tripartite tricarboxylate transporter substrate binding protein [Falsiroseomonas selenitidurans]